MAEFGFGAWQIGGYHQTDGRENGWRPLSSSDVTDLVARALDLGVRFFDTAQGYGHSEQLLGEALKTLDRAETATVCTKIALPEDTNRTLHDTLDRGIKTSLQRLARNTLDVLLLHNPPSHLIQPATLEVLEGFKKDGLIKAFGVSARLIKDVRLAQESGFGTYISWNYSVLERRMEEAELGAITNHDRKFIARSPLFRGMITQRFLDVGPDYEFGDVRDHLGADVKRWVHQQLLSLIPLAQDANLTLSEFALAYLYANPDVSFVIPGVSKQTHLGSIERIRRLSAQQLNAIRHSRFTGEAFYPPFA